MRDSLRTSVGQFGNAGRPANMRAVEPSPNLASAERGNFYLLVEVAGGGGGHGALYRQIMNAAQTAFYEAEGTIASALMRAVRSAHSTLQRVNEALPLEASWRAGISCVALKGRELTIAQAGPALVLVSHPKTVDLFPPEIDPSGPALGGPERPDVQLVRTQVEPGSIVLLAESGWLKTATAESLAAATTGEQPSQVISYLGQLGGSSGLSALVIGISSGIPEVQDEVMVARRPGLPMDSEAYVPLPAKEPAGGDGANGGRRGLFARLGKLAEARKPVAGGLPPAEDEYLGPDEEPVLHSPELPPLELEPEISKPAASERPKRSPLPLVVALVVIPLLIAGLVLGMWFLRNESQNSEFQDALSGARSAIEDALSQPDEAASRMRLAAAREFLDKARAIKPVHEELDAVQASYNESMDRINHVTPLYGVIPLWTFAEEGRQPARVVVKGTSLYVLDRGLQKVSHFALSELGDSVTPADPADILMKGQQVTDAIVGDLLDITWVEASSNQRSKLLALDAAATVVGYDVTWGAGRVPVSGRDQWGNAQLVGSYDGNLYVVDTANNKIWRHRASDNGYDLPPENYFLEGAQVDLAGVQSISIDGNIWLLYADGRLLKFLGGAQQPFELKGMPDPLTAPTAIAAMFNGDLIYIADAGNGRIVEFNKEGEFQRQFRLAEGDALRQTHGLYLDESNGALYILTTDQLYKADLPRPESATAAVE